MAEIKIEGIDALVTFFDKEPMELRSKVIGKALQSSVEPLKQAVISKTPIGTIPHEGKPILTEDGSYSIQLYNHLRDAATTWIGVTPHGGTAKVGFGDMGYIARWLEYGHQDIGHKPGLKDLGSFTDPHPFMRSAVANVAETCVEAFAEAVREFYGDDQ
jgi:hypothetical protein